MHSVAERNHEVEILVEVLHHPDHEPRRFHVKRHATLLEVLDEAARKLDVKLLPNPQAPLDRLRGVYEEDGTFFGLFAELDDTRRNMSYKTDAASAPQAANATLRIFASRDGGHSQRRHKVYDRYRFCRHLIEVSVGSGLPRFMKLIQGPATAPAPGRRASIRRARGINARASEPP